jgi:uncharacterized cupin superfamily protein
MSESQQPIAQHRSSKSFVDLRKFASDKSAGIPLACSSIDNRFLSSRRLLDWPRGPVSAGVIALDAGCGVVPMQPVDEFVIVAEGEIALSQAERELTLGPGDSALLGHGAEFSWSARGPVSVIFMRYHGSKVADAKIVLVHHAPQLEPSGTPPADLLLTPAPACRNFTDYRSANSEFVCGTWDSTPYRRSAMVYHHCELMYLLEGSVTFVDGTGRTNTFERGDIFLVERGAQCSWESREDVAKVYAIYRPA